MIRRRIIDSPVGGLILAADEQAVREVRFAKGLREPAPAGERSPADALLDRA